MSKPEAYTIGEMSRRSGLSVRALRHYEEQGLLTPGRTSAGRRFYTLADMLVLARISLLKRAGFSIAQIRTLQAKGAPDAAALVDAQAEYLNEQMEKIISSLDVLDQVRRRLKSGEPADAESLCQLIQTGVNVIEQNSWKKIYNRYYTLEEQEKWAQAKGKMCEAIDIEEYNQRWTDLAMRIGKALPLDPASEKAQNFLQEWNKLLEPLETILSPNMMEGASRLWRNIDDWYGQVDQPFTPRMIKFITAAKAAAKNTHKQR